MVLRMLSSCASEGDTEGLNIHILRGFWGDFLPFCSSEALSWSGLGRHRCTLTFDSSGLINIDTRHLQGLRTLLSAVQRCWATLWQAREASDSLSNEEPDWSYLANFSCCHLSVSVLPRLQSRTFQTGNKSSPFNQLSSQELSVPPPGP